MQDFPLLLGLDFGTAKVGVAVGSLVPTHPLEVIRYGSWGELMTRLVRLAEAERVEGLVVGWPADDLQLDTAQTRQIRQFGDQLAEQTKLGVNYYPETLTTQLATRRMLEEGISKQKRREVEDSYAAAAILDAYLLSKE